MQEKGLGAYLLMGTSVNGSDQRCFNGRYFIFVFQLVKKFHQIAQISLIGDQIKIIYSG